MGILQGTLTLETVSEGLRFRARYGEFTQLLDSGEGAAAPNPVMALLGALAACEAMDVISILRKKRLPVTGYRLEMQAERAETHPRRLTSVTIVHHVSGDGIAESAIAEAIALSEEKYCSVRHTLDPALSVAHRIERHPA